MKTTNKLSQKKHLFAAIVITSIISGGLAFVFFHFDFIPDSMSLQRQDIDQVLRILLTIGSVVFAIVITFSAYSLIFFRRRPGDESPGAPHSGNSRLEIAWTVIPLIIVGSLSGYGAVVLNNMTAPSPANTTLEVDVTAFRFGWQFQYPEYGVQSFELGVQVNRPIHFVMQSRDVIHSFWVPQWGPKQDIVPGMTTELWITPTDTGKLQVR